MAQFDFMQKLVEEGITYVLQDDSLMTKAKEELKNAAKEMSEENGESFEDTFRTMVEDNFNNRVKPVDNTVK